MTAVACTLVSLCVSLVLVSALPAAKRLPLSHDGDDVLAGSDFLSVFMRLRTADRPRHYDRELNSVEHKSELLSDKYALSNIFKYGYTIPESSHITTADPGSQQQTTTQPTEPTTAADILTTLDFTADRSDDQQTTVVDDGPVTILEPTQEVATQKVEEKVISVRVSSSVARHSHRTIETATIKSVLESVARQKLEDENSVTTLVTQEQPTITAVQRSDFAVEESSPPDVEVANGDKAVDHEFESHEEVEGRVQEVSPFGNSQQRTGKAPVFEIHYHDPPAALTVQRAEGDVASPFRRKEFRPYHQPTSYQTRVTSATSDSSVNFYREHGRSSASETVHQPVVTGAPYPALQESTTAHEERVYSEPEKVYGQPEVNYEVDEAVSVVTNGKAHGVQPPAPQDQDQNKFGYVVEGRNFRKYRVEERTADGFIVGEYGVVSHDDGSLRGVRYTADSTINPRLIYDTLVKFLSLQ